MEADVSCTTTDAVYLAVLAYACSSAELGDNTGGKLA